MLSGAVLLSIVAAIAAFALITWSRRESWRPWAFYAPCLLANLTILVLGRLGATSGAGAIAFAYDLQYFVEAHVLLIVALAIALSLPPRPAWLRADPRVRRIARAVVGAVAAFVVVSTIVSWNVMVDDSAALPSKSYIERAVSDLDQLTSEHPVDLIELTMPTEVNPFYVNGYNDVPGVIGVDAGLRRRLDAGSPYKVAVTSSGRVGRVAPVELVRLTPEQLARADVSDGVTTEVIDGRPCLTAPKHGSVSMRLPTPVEARRPLHVDRVRQ